MHVSATVFSASDVLTIKGPRSINILKKLNCGLFYNFSQVGKFVTVYCRDDKNAVHLARELDKVTHGYSGPIVPFDIQYKGGSLVFYRYGAFTSMKKDIDGKNEYVIKNDKGNYVADNRGVGLAIPEWVKCPFDNYQPIENLDILRHGYLVYEGLSQRGKGGVYKALRLNNEKIKKCIIKEGRKNGELQLDKRDGVKIIENEKKVLELLQSKKVSVPMTLRVIQINSTPNV